jgi:PPM family protein phosphatase
MADNLYDAAALEDLGTRPVLEDRARVERFFTTGGLDLQVALVCDGAGGQDRGDVAANVAVNATFRNLKESGETDVLTLIKDAAGHANNVVLREGNDGRSTLALIAIAHDGASNYGRMYIASIGDSRIGLLRDGHIRWLNYPRGVADEAISGDDGADKQFTRALGIKRQAEADIGFYHNAAGAAEAQRRGENGIRLEEGDVVFACSDGLVGINPGDGEPYIHDNEFASYGMQRGAANAVQSLVSQAKARLPSDNMALALVQVGPDSAKFSAQGARGSSRGAPSLVTAGVVIVALALFMVFIFSRRGGSEQQAASASSDDQGQMLVAMNATQMAQTVAAFTPTATDTATPTSTPTSAPLPGVVGAWFQLRIPNPPRNTIQQGGTLNSAAMWVKADLNQANAFSQQTANMYMFENTQVQVNEVDTSSSAPVGIVMTFFNGDMFTDNGDFTTETQIQVANTDPLNLYVQRGCLAIADIPQPDMMQVACFAGTCSFSSTSGGRTQIPSGSSVMLDRRQEIQVGSASPITPEMVDHYRQILVGADLRSQDYQECVAGYEPTATPTMTPTATATLRPTPVPVVPLQP